MCSGAPWVYMYRNLFSWCLGAELVLGFLVGLLKAEMPFGRCRHCPCPPPPTLACHLLLPAATHPTQAGSQSPAITVLCPCRRAPGWGLGVSGNCSPLGELRGQPRLLGLRVELLGAESQVQSVVSRGQYRVIETISPHPSQYKHWLEGSHISRAFHIASPCFYSAGRWIRS